MEYIKKLFFSIIPIIKYMILNYIVIFVFYFIYSLFGNSDMIEYINNYSIYVVLIFNIIYLFVLIKKYRLHFSKSKNIIELLLLGVSFSLFCNMIILNINSSKDVVEVNKIILIISSVIVGPFIEEILFRYILLGNLKKFNSKIISIILGSLIFSLMHNGIINIVYTFLLGLILGVIYLKKGKITDSIIVHSAANFVSIFLTGFNNYILLLSFILLVEVVCILKRSYFKI